MATSLPFSVVRREMAEAHAATVAARAEADRYRKAMVWALEMLDRSLAQRPVYRYGVARAARLLRRAVR